MFFIRLFLANTKTKNRGSPSSFNCWRALARQLPILYNSEKKAKSVGCKIEDMRSRLCFLYPGIPGCLCMHVEISIDLEQYSPAKLEIKDTINEVKYKCL